ncbi:MAG: auxin-responsive protein-like protein [Herbinix sp.]|nr:auxin-responsive protein-like protein [Herbinix sp.]
MVHMYVEMKTDGVVNTAVSKDILREHLSIYFKYFDNDYKDLKRILGVDPLKITILKCGTFDAYERAVGSTIRHMNPSIYEVKELLQHEEDDFKVMRREVFHG